jgi:hypothetical protein
MVAKDELVFFAAQEDECVKGDPMDHIAKVNKHQILCEDLVNECQVVCEDPDFNKLCPKFMCLPGASGKCSS